MKHSEHNLDTQALIARLSREAPPKPELRPPAYFALRLIAVLVVYVLGTQFCLGVRPDIAVQLVRPMFVLEAALLAMLTVSGTLAAILAMYPDAYRRAWMFRLPYAIFLLLVALIVAQLFAPADVRMVIPPPGGHAMKCALCIAATSLIPAALMFGLLRKGASVHPLKAGSFAVLAASGLGCLTLRLSEVNDSLMHLISWHYLPTLLFAAAGAVLGRYLLRW